MDEDTQRFFTAILIVLCLVMVAVLSAIAWAIS